MCYCYNLVLFNDFFVFASSLYKLRAKSQGTWLHKDWLDKCFESIKMTPSWKQYRQKMQNTARQKIKFFERISRKCRLAWIRIKQNNDHARIMRKIQFCSSFKIKSILINECQHKSTRVNTSQHESTRVRHESKRVQHESTRINTSPTRVN